jgi:hypothetical protein
MRSTDHRPVRQRLLPALLTAAGVTALAGGLLQYGVSAQPGPGAAGSPSAGFDGGNPGTSLGLPTLPPIAGSTNPSGGSSVAGRVATRIVIDSLGIDLPVIEQPTAGYPPCNVAMYFDIPQLGQPGEGRSVYIYSHAREGMFLPILTASMRNNGAAMLGKTVTIYTSDDQEFLYSIRQVIRHIPSDDHFLDRPLASTGETLWLQTSEGSSADKPKLQLLADPFLVAPADQAAAHPTPHPVECGP